MTTNPEARLQARLSAAKADEGRAAAERRAAADELRWWAKNRQRINSDALDLLLEGADDDMAQLIERVRSSAAEGLRERQRAQTANARAAVGSQPASEQSKAPTPDSASVDGAGVPEQGPSVDLDSESVGEQDAGEQGQGGGDRS